MIFAFFEFWRLSLELKVYNSTINHAYYILRNPSGLYWMQQWLTLGSYDFCLFDFWRLPLEFKVYNSTPNHAYYILRNPPGLYWMQQSLTLGSYDFCLFWFLKTSLRVKSLQIYKKSHILYLEEPSWLLLDATVINTWIFWFLAFFYFEYFH